MGTTQRYLMFFSYIGSGFWGSQIQILQGSTRPVETVQLVLENGLKQVFELPGERPIRVRLGSRTDKGVHALRAALHVDLPKYKGLFMKPHCLKFKLNRYFGDSKNVRILEIYPVPDSFTVSSAILEKTYMYRCGIQKEEFSDGRTKAITPPIVELDRIYLFQSKHEFDLNKAQKATALFEGQKDFGAIVGRPSANTKPTVCNIKSFTLELAQPLIPFDSWSSRFTYYNFMCTGERFLFHMVRRMVSLTLSVGFSILSLDDIEKLFNEPVPSSWPKHSINNVPGYGLYLVNVNIDLKKVNTKEDMLVENKTDGSPLLAES